MKFKIVMILMAMAIFATSALAAEPTGSQGKSVINEVKDIYVCQNGMYLSEADAAGALCPEGAKVLKWVERMVSENWPRQDVLELVSNLRMGKSLISKTGSPDCPADGKLKVEAFIMSYCPYGVKYVTDTLSPMIDSLGKSVDYQPYFIMQKDASGKFQAMHGQKEADENLRMVCLREKWGKDVWLKYTKCFANEIFNNRQAPKDWSYCATEAGVKPEELDSCFKNDAAALAEKDLKLSAQYNAGASPTAIYNCGSSIVGAIPFASIKSPLCRLIPGAKPGACLN